MGQSGGSARRCPRQREGQRRLRLAPGAAGKDKGGEGGSKMENVGGLGGSHRGRKTATTVVGNAPVRAAVARSSVWTRGRSLGRARRRAREGKGEASTATSGGF
jgi:hypothetical protein